MHRTEHRNAVGGGDLGDGHEAEPLVERDVASVGGHEATRNSVRVAWFDQRRHHDRTEAPTVAGRADADLLRRPLRLVYVVGTGSDDRCERAAGSHFASVFNDVCHVRSKL